MKIYHDSENRVVTSTYGDVDATDLGPAFVEIVHRWNAANTTDALPQRSLVDPGWVGRLISSSMLFQVEGDDMRHRVVGQLFISRNGGFDPTGQTVRDLFPTRPVARILYPEYLRVVAEAVPAILSLQYLTVKEVMRYSRVLILPFTDQDPPRRQVSHFLSLYRFEDSA